MIKYISFRARNFLAKQSMLRQGWTPRKPLATNGGSSQTETILHLLFSSIPYVRNGYGVRSHSILRSQQQLGLSLTAVTRPGFPWDLQSLMHFSAQNIPLRETVDEVTYRHLPDHEGGWGKVPLDEYLDRYAAHLSRVVEEVRPSVLHAASNFVNGCVAAAVGRAYGIPVVYEVRGFWEMTRAALEPGFTNSLLFRSHQRLETQALETADAVVCISEGLKREIERQGIATEKIWIVPNGVECSIFSPRPKDPALVAALGLKEKIVVGYLGSLEAYEGLDVLLQACAMLLRRKLPLKVVIGGDGAAKKKLEQVAKTLSLEEAVHFSGHLSQAEVLRYYSILDICPFPRRDVPVCHLVPPLKPYEAMAMEKAVVVSDVEALREMVQEGETGLVCRADEVESLAASIARLVEEPQLRKQISAGGRAWVAANRDWGELVKHYLPIYRALGVSPQASLSPVGVQGSF